MVAGMMGLFRRSEMVDEKSSDALKEGGRSFAARRKALGHTQQTLAKVFDVTRETVGEWERGGRKIPDMAWLALEGLEAQAPKRKKK